MKLTPSFVLALAAAAAATASPVYRRQAGGAGSAVSTATGSLPIPSAVSAISSAVGGPSSAPRWPYVEHCFCSSALWHWRRCILVVEGQHQSYLIAQTDDGGNAVPRPYATPLNFKQVYSLAAPFIESCPEKATIPITAFPALTLASASGENNGTFTPGQQVNVTYDSSNGTSSFGNKYLAVIQGIAGPQFLPLDSGSNSSSTITLPANLTGGQMYAVVTSSDSGVTDDNTFAGPAVGYVSVPLPEAPDATNTSSSSSSSASATATDSGAMGGSGSAPTPTDGVSSASGAAATATANGSDSIVSTESSSTTGSASASGASNTSQGLAPSLASLGSAKLPTPTP
ncbi:hypothetical protein NDA18_001725 [Ustilago nuda]|nr:hypothetical protein NDA18_001725 [Ustilago nuda]